MIDTQRGSRAVLDIVEGDDGHEAAARLPDELLALVERTAFDIGIDAPVVLSASGQRVVLGFAPRPAHHRRVEGFLDALAESLDHRNGRLDLEDRLRVRVTVDSAGGPPDLGPASPLSTDVLAATPAVSLVVEATERWYTSAVAPDATYRHVSSRLDTFWLRVPGRSTVPGIPPAALIVEPRRPDPGGRSTKVVVNTRRDRKPAGNSRGPKGTQAERLRTALVEAYPSFDEFAMMLREKLDLNLHSLAGAYQRLDLVVSQAIARADAEGWTEKLATAAFLGNPRNPALRRLWPQTGMLIDLVGDPPRPWSGTALERIFRKAPAFPDIVSFTARLLSVAGQVCQLRVGPAGGTGFLIGPDLVLTTHRVVVDVINGRVPRSEVRCVFDHHVDEDGRVHDGVAFELVDACDWLVEASAFEEQVHPPRPPTTGELDYAILRLARHAGRSMVSPDGRERGWLRLPGPVPAFTPGPLLILQHPPGLPLKLAMADKRVGAVVGGGTRVTYEVDTERGSSGSPCLTFDLQLVALHQTGRADHSVGIPISTIAAHLGDAARSAMREQ